MESIFSERYKDVFSSCCIGNLQFKNHIIRAATNEYCGNPDGSISDEQVRILSELARNDVAGIITGNYYVRADGRLDYTQNSIDENCDIPGNQQMIEAIHRYGSKVIIQISHAGSKTKIDKNIAEKYKNIKNLTVDEIHDIADSFVEASIRAQQLGADAVEIHCGHGYFLSSMLCARTNNRDDLYGGEDVTNRMRIIIEIISKIKKRIPEFSIWVKINCNDYNVQELEMICSMLKQNGIHVIEFSGNDFILHHKSERNYYERQAAYIKNSVHISAIMTGGVRSVDDAYNAIKKSIDMVGLSRPFISEPDLINKWKSGDSSRCLSCNRCFELYKSDMKRCVFC